MPEELQLICSVVVGAGLGAIVASMISAKKIRKAKEDAEKEATQVDQKVSAPPYVSASVREATQRAIRNSSAGRSTSSDPGFTTGVAYGLSSSDSSCSGSSSSSSSSSFCD